MGRRVVRVRGWVSGDGDFHKLGYYYYYYVLVICRACMCV